MIATLSYGVNRNHNRKMGAQLSFELNGNRNRNHVINRRCELTIRVHSHTPSKSEKYQRKRQHLSQFSLPLSPSHGVNGP